VGVLTGCKTISYSKGLNLKDNYSYLVKKIGQEIDKDTAIIAHIKGPDEYGHDGDFDGKVGSLENIDKWVIGPLIDGLIQRAIFIVTSDHATPCVHKTHSSDKVPFVISGGQITHNGGSYYSERACSYLTSNAKKGAELINFAIKPQSF
jgi:2,3-bisphosphoglycerate-independent phosphoglycerate mutase